MRKQGTLRTFRSITAGVLVTCAVLVSAPALAANSGCVNTPTLDNPHLSSSTNLGSGVTARSWTWSPGGDSENAGLSPLGTKVSVIEGNLRNVNFGVLHWAIPQTQTLKSLSQQSESSIASLNGDYFDGNGPWNAMVEDSQVIYSPPNTTGIVGMTRHRVSVSKGYRSTGVLSVGRTKYQVTGVNQPYPGPESMVIYTSSSAIKTPPKGQTTLVLKSGAVYKIYPRGAAVSSKTGIVIQARGVVAKALAKLKAKTKVKLSLPKAPLYETQMAADSINTVGTVSSPSLTLVFDSVNYQGLSSSGATVFDENFAGTPNRGKSALRLATDSQGRYYVKNVYAFGATIQVQSGELVIQANGSAARTVSKFKTGDIVNVKAGYRAKEQNIFIAAAGRGPRLVERGKFIWICAQHNKDYRPRSAIGWDQDGRVWLAASSRGQDAVDFGFRQGGSTADQMARWLMSLGATDVVLLDGGGSTTVEIKNPSSGWQRLDVPDSAWYRELANAFSLQLKG